jgi:Transglutaminase-like superfamily
LDSAQSYYREHGVLGHPGHHAAALQRLPSDIMSACTAVQGLLIHRDIAPWLYEQKLSAEQRDLANIRHIGSALTNVLALDSRALDQSRAPPQRLPSVCRHFSTLLAAILREHAIPARVRCGFGAYFKPDRFEDHWVAEYWNEAEHRWQMVDAQMDSIQREAFRLDFDPLDVPRDRFILAGDAWQMCRTGRAKEDLFGLSFINQQGLWWIVGNLVRDLAALNRMELLPWDVWGAMPGPANAIAPADVELFDHIAEITLADDTALPELRQIYENSRVRVPEKVFNADRKITEAVH